eukprot:48063-Alexandrium_andersonii.AAC.1
MACGRFALEAPTRVHLRWQIWRAVQASRGILGESAVRVGPMSRALLALQPCLLRVWGLGIQVRTGCHSTCADVERHI